MTVGRIRERSTFHALLRPAGRGSRGPVRVSFVPPASVDAMFPQVGYSISKRCGNAVTRNRLRRRLRAAVRELGAELVPGAYLMTTSAGAVTMTYSDLALAVRAAVRAAHEKTRPTTPA